MLCETGKFIRLASRVHGVQPEQLHAASLAIDCSVLQLCAGLSEDQLSWSASPSSWSIAENLAHVRAATEVFLPPVDAALAVTKDRNLRSQGPFMLGTYGRVIVWRLESCPMKLRAPDAIRPRLLGSAAGELEAFLQSQSSLRQRIESAKDLHLTALRFPSPLSRFLRFNLLEFFSVFNAHTRRHLRQAGNVRQALLPSQS